MNKIMCISGQTNNQTLFSLFLSYTWRACLKYFAFNKYRIFIKYL